MFIRENLINRKEYRNTNLEFTVRERDMYYRYLLSTHEGEEKQMKR